jgi:hypothetical protein
VSALICKEKKKRATTAGNIKSLGTEARITV